MLTNQTALSTIYRSNTPVLAQTNADIDTPIILGIAQVLDDYISIKRYGAMGDGTTIDTAAIQQALKDLYCAGFTTATQPMAYRELYFPAGNYIIDDYLYIPPYAYLVGDGQGKTIITQSNAAKGSVLKNADSLYQIGSDIGTNGAIEPTNIEITGITFQHNYDEDIVHLERASNVLFKECDFIAQYAGGESSSNAVYLDKIGGMYTHTNIKFQNCTMQSINYILNIDNNGDGAYKIYFDNCSFTNAASGITVIPGYSVSDVKVSNCYFLQVQNNSIFASAYSVGILSLQNTYDTCGTSFEYIIFFDSGSQYCQSISDRYVGSVGYDIIDAGTDNTVLSFGGSDFIFGGVHNTIKQPTITLLAAQTAVTTGVTFAIAQQNTFFIDYTIFRGTGVTRIGRISIVSDGTTGGTVLNDVHNDSAATGITFDFSISTGVLTLLYTSTAGVSATFVYQNKMWHS